MFTIARVLLGLEGVGRTGAAVWRLFGVVWRDLTSLDFSRGAVAFLQEKAKFIENIEVLEVVPKWAPLKTSLDVFKAGNCLSLREQGPWSQTPCRATPWEWTARRISVRFAEAAALP